MTLDELINAVRAAVGEDAGVRTRASLVADLVRAATGHRWVGVHAVGLDEFGRDETVNLAWSGLAHPEGPVSAAVPGLAAEASRTGRAVVRPGDSGAVLVVPVVDGQRVVGTLDVEDDRVDAFDQRRIDHLVLVAAELVPLMR